MVFENGSEKRCLGQGWRDASLGIVRFDPALVLWARANRCTEPICSREVLGEGWSVKKVPGSGEHVVPSPQPLEWMFVAASGSLTTEEGVDEGLSCIANTAFHCSGLERDQVMFPICCSRWRTGIELSRQTILLRPLICPLHR